MCIRDRVYTGGFFEGVDFVTAFADCSSSMVLVLGSAIALMFTFVFYRVRGVMTFQDFAACIPEGFKAMVSPMLILTLAWTLSGMTGLLGAKYYVASLLSGSAAAVSYTHLIFPLRLPLRGLKGASSPFLVGPARRNRWWFSGSLLTSKENNST